MLALRDSSVGLEGQRPSELVDEVSAIIQRVHRKVDDWAHLNQLRSFFQQSEIKQGIGCLHRDIDMAMQNINIQLGLHLARGQLETRAIQERDKAEIRELLERIVNSIEDMKALTEAHPSEIEDVMVSLQNELRDAELEPNQQHNFRYGLWHIRGRTAKLPPMAFPPHTIAPSTPRNERPSSSMTFPPHSDRTILRLDIPTSWNDSPEIGNAIYYSPSSEQDSSPAVSQFSGESSRRSLEQTAVLPQAEPGEAIYHLNSSMSVVSGTLEGLVERLINTNNLQKNLEYRDVLLSTLVDFTPAENFFAMLARRFYNAEHDQQLHTRNRVDIQYNVYALTLYWVSNSNFYVNASLLLRMKEFCISALSVKRSSTMNDKAKEVLRAIDARSASATISESPVCDIPRSSDMQPKHLAIALTLMEGDKYKAILPADYILHLRRETRNRVEAAKKVNKAIQFWVQYTVMSIPRLNERTRTLVFFVNTGQECLKMRNFASVAAIATALQSEVIQDHLKTTLGQLTSRQRQSMDRLISIINPAHKYQAYRKSLRQPTQLFERERCVPWIDVHIQDLGTVLESNRSTIEREGRTLINFERHIRFIDKVKEVLYYKPPDLEEYRSLGYLRYLEHRLRNIHLDDPKFEQVLLNQAKARELEEARMLIAS
ncbi:ras guanine nucleotide exchange factor domain-containing protein [Armillaria fumosa]|nr:ras guanine nucleotide exchange factor domain-containing protein [Armillaria fumosa]